MLTSAEYSDYRDLTTYPVADFGIKGKAVRIRCGPATVCGDESRNISLAKQGREEAASRMIHKPGDLPGYRTQMKHLRGRGGFCIRCV